MSDTSNNDDAKVSSRRRMLLAGTALAGLSAVGLGAPVQQAQAQQTPATPPAAGGRKPNILVIFGDDIGEANISRYMHGLVGYMTPNIDRIGAEGMTFTDYTGRTVARPTVHPLSPGSPRCGRGSQKSARQVHRSVFRLGTSP